jgi:putative ABC transport system substrate-binding protein
MAKPVCQEHPMRIRTALLALALIAGACGGSSQSPSKVFHIGLFHVGIDHIPPSLQPLEDALKAMGYVEGKNIQCDWRNVPDEAAANQTAKEFVREKVDLIVAFEGQSIRAADAATNSIPVVFLHALDPVKEGLAKTLSHPGGNMTGLIGFRQLAGKQLERFKNIMPSLQRVLAITDPLDPKGKDLLDDIRATAATLKLTLVERPASTEGEITSLFEAIKPKEVDGIVIASQDLQTKHSLLMISLALEHRLPISVGFRERVEKGGLFSYGPVFPAVGEAAAAYVDKILKGANPADLPVEEMTQLELVINQKVADDLGLKLSPEWEDAADEIINYITPTSAIKVPACA